MKLRVPLVRELAMLALGSGGLFRELFLQPPPPNLITVGICLPLMCGPAAVWVWLDRQRTNGPGRSSRSSGSRSRSPR